MRKSVVVILPEDLNDNLTFAGEKIFVIHLSTIINYTSAKKGKFSFGKSSTDDDSYYFSSIRGTWSFPRGGGEGEAYEVEVSDEHDDNSNGPYLKLVFTGDASNEKPIAIYKTFVDQEWSFPDKPKVNYILSTGLFQNKPRVGIFELDFLESLKTEALNKTREYSEEIDLEESQSFFNDWKYLVGKGKYWYRRPNPKSQRFVYEIYMVGHEEETRTFQVRYYSIWNSYSDSGNPSTPHKELFSVFELPTVRRHSRDPVSLNSDGTIVEIKVK
jgi:hypothetical protein